MVPGGGYLDSRCREMATLPAGYIPQCKNPSASSSGSLGFIVCVKCFRMVDSVPILGILSPFCSQYCQRFALFFRGWQPKC